MSEDTKKEVNNFAFLNDLSYDKKYLFNEDTESEYPPFYINKGMMQHRDTILLVNRLNRMPTISKEMHHDFLFYSVSKNKRYGKWVKSKEDDMEAINILCNRYRINKDTAIEYLKLLTEEQQKQLKQENDDIKGGLIHEVRKVYR